jgi:hypothetical protein
LRGSDALKEGDEIGITCAEVGDDECGRGEMGLD